MTARRRPAVRVVVGLLLATAGLAAPSAASARPAQDAPATPTLSVVEQPVAVAADGVFYLQLAIEDAPAGSDLAVDIYDRATDADDIATAEARDSVATFLPVVELADEPTRTQASGFLIGLYREGQDRPQGLDYTFQLDAPGAYPLRVRLRDGDDDLVATLVTSIVRLPAEGEAVSPAAVAVLTTVHADPPADPAARAAADGVGAELLQDLPPVLEALEQRPTLPASFSVTPDTAARLAGDPEAGGLLTDLRTEVGRPGRDLLDAPFVDLDPAGLAAAGLGDELTRQRDLGRRTLADVLVDPVHGTWALNRAIDLDGLAALRGRGITRVVLPAEAVAAGSDLGTSRLGTGRGEVATLVTSADLSVGSTPDPVLAAHRLFARLAATATAGPASLVLAIDPADVDPDTLALVLDGLTLGTDLFQAAPLTSFYDDGPEVAPPTLAAPAAVDLGPYAARLDQTRADLASFSSMVGDQPELVAPYERPLALSAAADLALDERLGELDTVTAAMDAAFSSVVLPELDEVTLGSRRAEFPLTITSGTGYPIRVRLDFESNERLRFPESGEVTDVPADGRRDLKVAVDTKAPGDTPVRIVMRTPDGQRVLAEGTFAVRSTAVSGLGLALMVGAGAFLALWWGRHWHRNRTVPRHARGRRGRATALAAATGASPPDGPPTDV